MEIETQTVALLSLQTKNPPQLRTVMEVENWQQSLKELKQTIRLNAPLATVGWLPLSQPGLSALQ